jgi:hypothetical protein
VRRKDSSCWWPPIGRKSTRQPNGFAVWAAQVTVVVERADMLDTAVGQGKKDDAADVARVGFDAMMRGDGDVVSGWKNKLQSPIANVTPAGILAEQHQKMAEPGSAQQHTD